MKTIKAREVRGFLRISCKKCGRELVSLSRGCDNEKLPYRCLCGDFLDSREIEVAIGNFKSHKTQLLNLMPGHVFGGVLKIREFADKEGGIKSVFFQ